MSLKADYYTVLGVTREADGETIKKAYRAMALKYHPDRNQGDAQAEERFKEAAEAYEVLSDPEKRNLYDQFGHDGLKHTGFQGFSGFGDIFSSFGDIFSDIFGSSQSVRRGPKKGRDLGVELRIDFVESYTGTEKDITIPREENCETCSGTGSKSGIWQVCSQCGGQGQIFQNRGFFRLASTCPQCHGTGEYAQDPCPDCQGTGRVHRKKTLSVKVPAGVNTGFRLLLRGQGEAGPKGGQSGDLYVEVFVHHHDSFSRERNHLILEHKIDMVTAALGGEIQVPTLTGESQAVKVPAGSQNGKLIRLPNLGFKDPNGHRQNGDFIVAFNVTVPKDLTERQRELLVEFAQIEEEKSGQSILRGLTRKVGKKLKNVFHHS
ncbi:MAG: molecular chaperone DnaJ [Deltaproteobacteria bacterium]|jgi:molecular chaperone DnaJ|nr:molecular chaperone DnaJ [Deltaproteobacteria bacterium]